MTRTMFSFADQKNGGLLTLFLHDPLLAFCAICNANNLRQEVWNKCQSFLDKIFSEILEILFSSIKEIGMFALNFFRFNNAVFL